MIRVLVVEDSPLAAKVIANILESDPELKVIAVANSGREGIKLVLELKPDIITMDIAMPDIDGVEATKQIMAYQPTPILLLTSSSRSKMDDVFKAISFGALDVEEKMDFGQVFEEKRKELLIKKIKLLSLIKVIRHPLARLEKKSAAAGVSELMVKKALPLKRVVAIATSTGGPQALASILAKLPKDFPWGILIVQHIAKSFDRGLAEWLGNSCEIKIKLAEDKEEIKGGTAYIAPNDFQMKVKEGGLIILSNEVSCGNFKPSADVLFKSVAEVYRYKAVGIILTGMGKDGASGIKLIKEAGGRTIAQDEKTSLIFGMPKEAIEMGGIDKVLPVDKIAEEILNNLPA